MTVYSSYRLPNNKGINFRSGGRALLYPSVTDFPALAAGNLWLNLDFAADYVPENFFIDAMRQSRPWRAGTSGSMDDATLRAVMMSTADADGYPTVLPSGVEVAGTTILLEQATDSAPALAGRYRLEWQGTGTVSVWGAPTGITSGTNWIEFDYTPTGGNGVFIDISSLPNPADNIRAMRCYNLAHAGLLAAGQIVNPAFKAAWPNISLIRPMQSFGTNTNTNGDWAFAPTLTSIGRDASYHGMIQAANELGANLWINVPAQADTNYATQLAILVRDNLNPALKCYVEWANEYWNYSFGFQTYPYLEALVVGKPYNYVEMAGGRSTETMLAWTSVFAGQMNRIVRVAGMHTGYVGSMAFRGIDEAFLEAPGWVAEVSGRVAPHTVHDAIALTGYFNVDDDWEETLTTATTNYAAGYDMLVAKAFAHVEGLRTYNYPYFQEVANLYGLDTLMYEGGSHVINPGGLSNPTLANTLINDFNTGTEIYDVYDAMFQAWHEFSTNPFNQFIGISDSAFGCMAHLNDTTQPRYQAVLDYNDGTLPSVGLTPVSLSSRLVITGHSIPDNILVYPLAGLIETLGGTVNIWKQTGPYASAEGRYTDDPALPTSVRALMETPGAAYDLFLGGEGHGASHNITGRDSVQTYATQYSPPAPSGANQYALLWHNLAASTGAQTFYFNFWQDDTAELFGSSWRSAQDYEMPLWDGIIDYVNANRAGGTPAMRLLPWLQVFVAVYDAIQTGDITGITMGDLFNDNVHPATDIGKWIQMATILAVMYHRHPNEMPISVPLQFSGSVSVSSGLAAQLRPIIWNACLSNPRTGLA